MANLNAKGAKIYAKKHKILTKKLTPKGTKFYILRRNGRTQAFETLATFPYVNIETDNYRTAIRIEFAVTPGTTFVRNMVTRTMREVAAIAEFIAIVMLTGESVVYAIRKGEESQPLYIDFTYKFFCDQISDTFVPADNV